MEVAGKKLDGAFENRGYCSGALLTGEANCKHQPQDVQPGSPLHGPRHAHKGIEHFSGGGNIGASDAAQGGECCHHQQITCGEIIAISAHNSSIV
ncbi:MAG: hypothetical protein BWY63_03341 [Chloroflexi bacterium ADurb.Bin360]|nr:MAG: hypothetical protein BWY63_03341 [Chloroflexi bacterium ADurb.Bin360]